MILIINSTFFILNIDNNLFLFYSFSHNWRRPTTITLLLSSPQLVSAAIFIR